MSLVTQMKGPHLGSSFALFACSSSSHSLLGSQWHNLAGHQFWLDCGNKVNEKANNCKKAVSGAWCSDDIIRQWSLRAPAFWVVTHFHGWWKWSVSGRTVWDDLQSQDWTGLWLPILHQACYTFSLFLTKNWFSHFADEKMKSQRRTLLVKITPTAKLTCKHWFTWL